MSASARWSLAALVVVGALIAAIWPRGGAEAPAPIQPGPAAGAQYTQERRPADTPEALAGPRAQAALAPCPSGTGDVAPGSPLGGLTLGCLADGSPVPLAAVLAGRPAVVNIWAYWCGPCAEELPALQEYAERRAGEITVLTVHRDPNEANALLKLADYGVRLPGVQDGAGAFAAAVGAPNVLPVTVVLRADGTVARVLPVAFTSADDIDKAVQDALGVGG
jgi:thiol-disulfide isomerase/thioredoxin